MDILDFIDSEDIRNHNRDTRFTPMEQAVLIYHSKKTTVEEKLAAWHELLDRYSEEAFQTVRFETENKFERSNRQILMSTVVAYEEALASRTETAGVVFETSFYECNFPDNVDLNYFSDYNSAMDFLVVSKQHYLDDEDLRNVAVAAEIRIKPLNTNHPWADTVFWFDTNLRMIDISVNSIDEDPSDWGMDSFFVYVPLPFKKGDILRTIKSGEVFYGVMPRDPDEKYFSAAMKHGDGSDMIVTLDDFYKDGDKWVFGYDHYNFLFLEKCPNDELPDEQSILRLLKAVYTGKMEAGHLLYLYSKYGEDAYSEAHMILGKVGESSECSADV